MGDSELNLILQSAFESVADAVLVFDSNDRVVAFNSKFTQLWNCDAKLEAHGSIHPWLDAALTEVKDPAALSNRFVQIRLQPVKNWLDVIEFNDGRVIEHYSIPQMLGDKCIAHVESFRDVTKRRRIEAALSAVKSELTVSNAIFRTVFESAPVGITLLDTRGEFVKVNPTFCAMLGYSEDEMKTLGIRGISLPEEYTKNQTLLSQLIEGKIDQFEMEKRYLPKNGPLIWGDLRVSLGRGKEGHPLFAIGIIADIDKERTAKEALRFSEERFRAIFESTDLGIGLLDLQGNIVKANPALVRLLGYTEDELHQLGVPGISHPDDLSVCWAHLTQLAKGCIDHYDMEKRFIRKDGGIIWCHLTASLVCNARGQPSFCIGMLSDITERKDHEEERDRLLFQEWKAHQAAIKAIRLRDDFLAIASHELRTPLTPLKLQVQFLRNQLLKGALGTSANRPELLRMLEISEKQVDRLHELVENVLDAALIRSGPLVLALADMNLSTLVENVVKETKGEFYTDRLRLTLDLASGVSGHWDRLRIEQVIRNLFTNAIKYGCGRPIQIITLADGDFVKLIVRDHGIGISEEDQKKIFGEFERIGSVENYGGFGLGLYITQKIVEAHGGTIKVESQLNQGTTFVVELPVRPIC